MDREVIHQQFIHAFTCIYASQVMLVVKNLPANVVRHEKQGLSPGKGRQTSGGGHGNTLHYSCLENPMDRGAWQDSFKLKYL